MSSINIDHLATTLCNKVMAALTESLQPIIQAAIDEALKSRLDELFSTVKHLQSEVASRDDCIVYLEKRACNCAHPYLNRLSRLMCWKSIALPVTLRGHWPLMQRVRGSIP